MTVPPYVVACAMTVGISWWADRLGQRGIFLLGCQACAIVGWVLLVSVERAEVQYAGVFLAAGGIYSFSIQNQLPLMFFGGLLMCRYRHISPCSSHFSLERE